jgi:peptidoglycan hydrolase-like protein with peptidoglycan-binding domain
MQPRKFRILSAVTAGSLALAAAAITASSGTSQPAKHAALAAQSESIPPVNLDNCPTLHAGYATGGCVAQLQTDLNSIQGNHLAVDGSFGSQGSQTYNAVIAFQQAHGLPQDGLVGPATKQALDAALSVPTPTAPPVTTPASPPSQAPSNPSPPTGSEGLPQNTPGPQDCSLFGPGVAIKGQNARLDYLCLTNIYTPYSLVGDPPASVISPTPLLVGLSYNWRSITGDTCFWWVDFNVYRDVPAPGQQGGLIQHSQGTMSPNCDGSGHGTRYNSGANTWLPLQLQPGDQVCVTMWRRGSGINNFIRVAGACQHITAKGVA